MTGYLRSLEHFHSRLLIGPNELTLSPATPAECEGLPLLGYFSHTPGEPVYFYRWNGRLRLRFGAEPPLAIERYQVTWDAAAGQVRFRVFDSGSQLLSRMYPLSADIAGLGQDPTPFVEAEDFDLLLMARNVLHDQARSRRIFPEAR